MKTFQIFLIVFYWFGLGCALSVYVDYDDIVGLIFALIITPALVYSIINLAKIIVKNEKVN
jgi:hypothetical protein